MDSAIIACTHLCPLPLEERRQKAVGTFSVLNEDRVVDLQPDLVITATLVQAKGAQRLRDRGLNVLHLDPRRLSEVAEQYAILGEAVGRAEAGQHLRTEFLNELEKFQPKPLFARGSAAPLRVYAEEWHEPPFVAGNWVPDLVQVAGGEAVLSEPGQPSRAVTLAEIEAEDPDVIIQHVCLPPLLPESTDHDRRGRLRQREQRLQQLLNRPGWDKLRAVRAGHVFAIDDTPFNMPTRGVLQGSTLLREVLVRVSQAVRISV
jgi:ABC-type Fe3+-hydroxamate transport system substrate-binding protein